MTTTSKQLIQIFGLSLLVAFESYARAFQYKYWLILLFMPMMKYEKFTTYIIFIILLFIYFSHPYTEMYPECVIASWDALVFLLDAQNIEQRVQ